MGVGSVEGGWLTPDQESKPKKRPILLEKG